MNHTPSTWMGRKRRRHAMGIVWTFLLVTTTHHIAAFSIQPTTHSTRNALTSNKINKKNKYNTSYGLSYTKFFTETNTKNDFIRFATHRHDDTNTQTTSSTSVASSSSSSTNSPPTTTNNNNNNNNNNPPPLVAKSRMGVRKRVKQVLEKARNRTGVVNRSHPQIVAEAAAMGANVEELQGDLKDSRELIANDNEYDNIYKNGRTVPSTTSTSMTTNNKSYANDTETELALRSVAPSVDAELTPYTNGASITSSSSNDNSNHHPASNGDAIEPLPFVLPQLTPQQKLLLQQGERIQEQSKMGREGSGYVVLDVQAPPYVVWECLLDFEAYPELIGTVRSMRMFTSTHLNSSYIAETPVPPSSTKAMRHYGKASITRASFVLSKFRLNIAAIHKYQPHPEGHYMVFTLDRACRNVVLQDAKGIWHTQANPDGRAGVTRVWLLCEVQVSDMLPSFIVEYAARKAMPRATTWVKPTIEKAAAQFGIVPPLVDDR